MKQIAAHEAVSLLKAMTRVLCCVGILALVFTTVNVTRFATSRGIPLPVAVLLDPMIGTALAGVLYVDARLASWGLSPPAWSTTLRWGAGCTAALMNTWSSLWPDGQIGWPDHADPAAVLLHLTPALLLIALTETIAAYRRTVTELLDQIATADLPRPPDPPTGPSAEENSAPDAPTADRAPSASSDPRPTAADRGHRPVPKPTAAPKPRPGRERAAPADLWPRAVALNQAAHATTGKPVSLWRLRTDLGIGPHRARQIRDQLLTRNPPPPTD